MVATRPKQVQKVLNILGGELKFFLRWFHIAKEMERDEEQQNKDEVLKKFKKLKIFQSREQWKVPVDKLKNAVNGIIHHYPPKIQSEIKEHVQNMGRLEGRILINTANKLKDELEKEPINWDKVKSITDEIIHFLRALGYVDIKTKKLVEG
ncbi:hypothetical protein CMO87_02030 [Candidatus Woesearchaeota archaeon]|jgi:hypothetical protein|nr:hypothetical protein [Candidatus Woesearchaeota archaeon]|tara:strand:+ start:65 stop:517 length:453 start_codon:yes stop_codon:yes gene_type:complete